MISATNISKQFGKLKALDNITVTYPAGECIALIGPNGSGKTTFIKSILGMVVPDSGKILFKGKDIAHDCHYRSDIGYMPQIGRYPENMTIGQVLEMMKDIRNHEGSLDDDLINDYNFKSLLNKRMRTLSGGTRQKVSGALAFMFNPEILILDEPTAGLDPVASEILKQKIVSEKQNGKLILITSHVLSELDDIVTQVMYMQDGKMVFYKPFDQLQFETGENKLSKAIATVMQQNQYSDIL